MPISRPRLNHTATTDIATPSDASRIPAKRLALALALLSVALTAGCSSTSPAQQAAEDQARATGLSDGSQLIQQIDQATAQDFCDRNGATNRDWQQSSNGLSDQQANSLVQPYVEGCIQGYQDSRR